MNLLENPWQDRVLCRRPSYDENDDFFQIPAKFGKTFSVSYVSHTDMTAENHDIVLR